MKDLSEEVVSGSATQVRRRAITVTATNTHKSNGSTAKKSLPIERVFSYSKTSPFDQLEWERRTAEITDDAGKVIFKQENVEVPKSWSLLATKNRKTGQAERARTQYEYPQCSACFIQSVQDNMESIMHLAHSEAMLFKFGSGTGTDLSPIRSSKEKLSGGGRPSGPLSFLKVYDQVANVVKSGGKTRRAAKMNTLRDWHGDIEEFIDAKQKEEKKAWALIEQGYDGSYNGDAYGSVMYQNENLSVRVSDEFMQAAVDGREWWTRSVTTGQPLQQKDAGTLLEKIAEGTWI